VKYGVGDLYDKQKAAKLLHDAGYGIKKADGTYRAAAKDGSPLKLTVLTSTGGGTAENIVYFVKQELAEIGIEVELKLVPWETMVRKYLMSKVPGSGEEPRWNSGPSAVSEESWDMVLMAFSTDIKAPSGSEIFFITDGGLNFMGYSNVKIDELFKRVKSAEALDIAARKKLYAEISKLLSEEQPVDFLTFGRGNIGFQKNVQGVEPGISMGYNYHLWRFE
jgi:peptide/nickel transport system substrate-binding protein